MDNLCLPLGCSGDHQIVDHPRLISHTLASRTVTKAIISLKSLLHKSLRFFRLNAIPKFTFKTRFFEVNPSDIVFGVFSSLP